MLETPKDLNTSPSAWCVNFINKKGEVKILSMYNGQSAGNQITPNDVRVGSSETTRKAPLFDYKNKGWKYSPAIIEN